MRRPSSVLFVVTAAVAVASSAACGGSSKPSPFRAKAAQLVDDIAAGHYDAVAKQFDPTMAAHLSADELAVDWRSIQRDIGTYRSKGTPQTHSSSSYTTELVPLQMEGGRKAVVQVTYHNADGTIAGLYFTDPTKKPTTTAVPSPGSP